MAARMVDQDPPHDLRSDAQKMCPASPVDGALLYQLEISLMDQSSCLQGMVRAFSPHIPVCESPHLVVNQRNEFRSPFLVSVRQVGQENGYFTGGCFHLATAHFPSDLVFGQQFYLSSSLLAATFRRSKTPITYCTFTRLKRDFLSV